MRGISFPSSLSLLKASVQENGLRVRLFLQIGIIIDHSVKSSADSKQLDGVSGDKVISRRMQFVEIDSAANAINAGWAPHLDLEPIKADDHALIQDILNAPWLIQNLEQIALNHASTHLVPEHFDEVKSRQEQHIQKTMDAVRERLVREINYWSDRYSKLTDDKAAGKDVRLNIDNVRRTIDDLSARLELRQKELEAMRHMVSATPVVVGGALIIPQGLLLQRQGKTGWTVDVEARQRVEKIAMQAVIQAENALGHQVIDVSAQKCGWDVTSIPKAADGKLLISRHIEVKGRAKGQTTITVTRNEILYGLNQSDKFILAIVIVDGDSYEGPFYVYKPFSQEPDWAVSSINLELSELLLKSTVPQHA